MSEDLPENENENENDSIKASKILGEADRSQDQRSLNEERFEELFEESYLEGERKYASLEEEAHAKGVIEHYKEKKLWSKFVIFIMTFMVIFQMILIVNVGRQVWDYTDYDWLLPALMIQYFGQIVGLAWLIVRSLYSNIREIKQNRVKSDS